MNDSDSEQSDAPDDYEPQKKCKKISQEIEDLLREAYTLFLNKNFQEAITKSLEVIQKTGGDNVEPYYVLYQCYSKCVISFDQ
jgi:hypothetical protein